MKCNICLDNKEKKGNDNEEEFKVPENGDNEQKERVDVQENAKVKEPKRKRHKKTTENTVELFIRGVHRLYSSLENSQFTAN